MNKLLGLVFVAILAVGCSSTTTKTKKAEANATEAKAEATPAPTAGTIECKSGNDVRKIELKEADAAFEVVYTKFGEAKSIATGSKEHCEAISNRVKTNLTNAGYTCS